MKQIAVKKIFLVTFCIILAIPSIASQPVKSLFKSAKTIVVSHSFSYYDSIHSLHFRYADRKRGIKPFIAPALLAGAGTALHFSDARHNFNDWFTRHFSYSGHADDYLGYVPLAAVYSLNAIGVKGKNNYGNLTAIAAKSFLLNGIIVYALNQSVDEDTPRGDAHSFPSGHTSIAFVFATLMHHEFGDLSPWYSVGAYACATTVGIMRIAQNAHWASDVLAGAGIGILSTQLIYLTHLYKWDKAHIRNLDIFPFSNGKQKGMTLVYKF